MSWNKKSIGKYILKIPEEYRKNIFINGLDLGGKTEILYMNNCGHESITTIGSLLQRKQLDLCLKCSKGSSYLEKIPKEYLPNIKGDISSYNSIIEYTNPKCNHISKVKIGYLSNRAQFDYCLSCVTALEKKTAQDYLKELSKDIYDKIIDVGDDNGRKTIVKILYDCGNVHEVQIHALLQNGIRKCKCEPINKLTREDIILSISPYLNEVSVGDGFPGNRTTEIRGVCKKCGSLFESRYFNAQQYFKYHKSGCPSCNTQNEIQSSLYSFVKTLDENAKMDNRDTIKFNSNKFKELDIYCKDYNFAIEYNGLLWHSEKYKTDKYYHKNKTEACKERGISLLHIWSDRYLEKPDVYKSIIRVKLGKVGIKIPARKTKIKELSKHEIKDFFGKNHIDGNVNCITGWGLFYNGILVQAISVRKASHQNKSFSKYLEVARSATLLNYLVVGGESKLLNCVEGYAKSNDYFGILNYVSCDFGGVPKDKWKFEFHGYTDVSYFYTDGSKRISRQRLQKRPKGQTEKDLANELGLFRVYGTPNIIYTLRFS
jgi:hypothetical protein